MLSGTYHKGTAGKPRSGLVGSLEFTLQNTLITPLTATLSGSANFGFMGVVTPGMSPTQFDASGTLVLDNYDVLSSDLVGRSTPIQNVSDQSPVAWFLDNVGGGTECCIPGTVSTGDSSFLPIPEFCDDTDAIYFYFGWSSVSGDWLVRRQLRETSQEVSATGVSNPGVLTISEAWPQRDSLIYS